MNENVRVEETTLHISIRKISYDVVKRLFDILVSIIGLLLIIPIAIIIKVCYMATGDFKTIFYYQDRVGKNGKIFKFFKFRSMVPNADEVLKQLLKDPKYNKEWQKNQKFEHDPRITKIGNFIRKTSIDELPQFINVFLGDMSLIGPRPLIIGELDEHNGNHELYESVKPGISGWWAANGRSNVTYDERLQLEYFYIKNMSLSLDVKCIIKTVLTVLSKKGAK